MPIQLEVQETPERRMTIDDGLLRFIPHFGGWLGLPIAVLFMLTRFTGLLYNEGQILLITFEGAIVFVLVRGSVSTLRKKQTVGKTVIDSIAKLGGLAVALLTSHFWWR